MVTTIPYPNCLHCSPSTTEDHKAENDFEAGFRVNTDVFPIIIGVFIVAANSLVIALVATRRNLRTVTNYILTSLAVSDLCTGAISIPLFLSCNITHSSGFCNADLIVIIFTSVSTVLHIVAMSIDRYICIIHALRYQIWVTKRRGWCVIAFIWFVALFMALIQLAWKDLSLEVKEDQDPETQRIVVIYDIFRFVVFIGIPVFFMAFTYARILHEVHRQTKNIHRNNTPGWQETQRSTRKEWKVAIIFLTMMIIFIICWVPFFLLRIEQTLQSKFFQLNFSDITIVLIYWLRLCSSLINPCLYILCKPDFRKATCHRKRKQRRNCSADSTRISLMKSSAV